MLLPLGASASFPPSVRSAFYTPLVHVLQMNDASVIRATVAVVAGSVDSSCVVFRLRFYTHTRNADSNIGDVDDVGYGNE